jgi:hypothetical protein
LSLHLINIQLANPVFVRYTESARRDEKEVRVFLVTIHMLLRKMETMAL